MREKHEKLKWWILGVIMVLNLIAMLITVHLTLRDLAANEAVLGMMKARQTPGCSAIPVQLILDDPECADKLLRAMNVARVRIRPWDPYAEAMDMSTIGGTKDGPLSLIS